MFLFLLINDTIYIVKEIKTKSIFTGFPQVINKIFPAIAYFDFF